MVVFVLVLVTATAKLVLAIARTKLRFGGDVVDVKRSIGKVD